MRQASSVLSFFSGKHGTLGDLTRTNYGREQPYAKECVECGRSYSVGGRKYCCLSCAQSAAAKLRAAWMAKMPPKPKTLMVISDFPTCGVCGSRCPLRYPMKTCSLYCFEKKKATK
jgi:hypothetical protein